MKWSKITAQGFYEALRCGNGRSGPEGWWAVEGFERSVSQLSVTNIEPTERRFGIPNPALLDVRFLTLPHYLLSECGRFACLLSQKGNSSKRKLRRTGTRQSSLRITVSEFTPNALKFQTNTRFSKTRKLTLLLKRTSARSSEANRETIENPQTRCGPSAIAIP
jgi:hypothetical protein